MNEYRDDRVDIANIANLYPWETTKRSPIRTASQTLSKLLQDSQVNHKERRSTRTMCLQMGGQEPEKSRTGKSYVHRLTYFTCQFLHWLASTGFQTGFKNIELPSPKCGVRRQAQEKESNEKLNWKLHCLDKVELTYYEDAQQRQCHILTRLSLAVSQNFGYGEQASGNFATTSQICGRWRRWRR